MATGPKVLYEFGSFRVDPDKQLLLRQGCPVDMTPKAFETLLALIRHSREVVTKDELMKAVWPDTIVEEANLSQNIFVLRKTLGDTPEAHRYIVTIPGRGYRFAADVRAVTDDSESLLIASRSRSQVVIEQTESTASGTLPALSPGPLHKKAWSRLLPIGAALGLLIMGAVFFLFRHQPTPLGEKDFILVADFTNTTGDPLFDDTLRQGLEVQLEQSPFLRLVSGQRIQHTLSLMGQPPDTRLTPAVAQEVCERTASTAVLGGSISRLGSQYVLGLDARGCSTGDVLAEEQTQVARQEEVLTALSQMATELRSRLGESLSTIKEHDTSLSEATTPSLEALKAYSQGWRILSSKGESAAIPFFRRAVAIDTHFAMAYAVLGLMYGHLGESAISAESTGKAYKLRDRASDEEKFFIEASYEGRVTGNMEKARQTCEAWAQAYPRDPLPHGYLGAFILVGLGNYSRALEEANKAVVLAPDLAPVYDILSYDYESLNRLNDAERVLEHASDRNLIDPDYIFHRYALAFLKEDKTGMAREAALAKGNAGAEDWTTDYEAFAFAYSGQLKRAKEMLRLAVSLAQQAGFPERAALFEAGAAAWESFFGNASASGRIAQEAIEVSKDREVEYGAAFALALSGDSHRSEALANDLEKRYPEDTSVRFSYLPTLRALLALNHGEPSKAVELLQITIPYELGERMSSMHGNFGNLYPVYVRGEALLALHQGAQAAAEFQKILDHRGIVVSDPVGAIARLQLSRALALDGDNTRAKVAYGDFLKLWKDADPGIPVLKQAESEFARLQ
ncbi:MAG TPA: winged helix-turn-helix domain-containing protein [Terriglobia bacterium]|nr:winged helix-turn-helix domain-containing protein [Terriglobia bacterium]